MPSALKEWRKLGATVRNQFAKKLDERLAAPRVPSARLREFPNCYKIKLRKAGFRLVYRIDDDRIVVLVVAVGRRERNEVYNAGLAGLSEQTPGFRIADRTPFCRKR